MMKGLHWLQFFGEKKAREGGLLFKILLYGSEPEKKTKLKPIHCHCAVWTRDYSDMFAIYETVKSVLRIRCSILNNNVKTVFGITVIIIIH